MATSFKGFAELVCQSNFSFLEAASHPEELIRQAYFLRYQAIAITDECSMAGVVRAYTEIRQSSLPIKLIVGSKFIFEQQCFVLLCPTKAAYSECCRIISNARRRASKGHYELSEWDLKSIKHCLCIWLPSQNTKDNDKWAKWLNRHYIGRVWMGVYRWLTANEYDHIHACEALATRHDIPIIASSNVRMHTPERQALQDCLQAIKRGVCIKQLGRDALANQEASLRSLEKLKQLYPVDWLENTLSVANACHFTLDELAYQYPAELVPSEHNANSYLRYLVELGKQQRFPQGVPTKVEAIIEKELKLIHEQQYEYFFLTIYDIVQFAKKHRILYQGRGSAANSVVCYCLEITAVDPRQIDVLFERFISKERNEPPDIDVDFEHERREEVIQYIYQKYGRERTALAATVVCYRFKSAMQEVGKVLGINPVDLAFFIKNVNRRDRTLSWQSQLVDLGISPDSLQGKTFIHLVEQLIGFPRHLSQHVGGFVISSGPLYEMVPIENAAMADRTVIQWDKDDLESLKLLKVDVLALGMLTAIRKSFSLIDAHYKHTYSIAEITALGDDQQVYKQIQQADTLGVFQIESRAQMSMLPRLKPKTYYDLVVQIAIVRPGPIQGDMVHPYLKRRDGKEAITYPSKEVELVLSRTMGVPIFQEQVIKLAMVAAGFSGGEADALRRAMAAWKKNGELFKFKNKLIDGMQARGYSHAYAMRLFEQICGFGEYGFPESHSASFAVLAYVSAWLKHYYPACFYIGLLNSLPMGFYSPSQIIQDAKRHRVPILPLCVLNSNWDHKIEVQKNINGQEFAVRLGLRLVKGLKRSTADEICVLRQSRNFSSMAEFRQLNLPSSCVQALASANAFHALVSDRYQARWALMDDSCQLPLLRQSLPSTKTTYIQQPSLFDNLVEDYASTGVSVKSHPINLLASHKLLPSFIRADQLHQVRHKQVVNVIGLVTGKQSPGTAAGVTFITLEDDTGNINVIVWQASARAQKSTFLNAKILHVRGILERGDGGVVHVIAGKLIDISEKLQQLKLHSREFR